MSSRSDKWDRWRKILQQQRASGLSVRVFCRQMGVPQSSLFAWRKRLRGEADATFAEVKLPRVATSKRGDVTAVVMSGHSVTGLTPKVSESVEAATTVTDGSIELRLPGRRCVVVRRGFDRQTLIELLHALETNTAESDAREASV